MIPYLVLLSSFIALFAFCFSNYLQWGDIFAAMTWLVRPTIFVIAFFIFCGYEIAVKVHENSVAEYAGSYGQGLWRALTAIMLSLLTVVAIPSLMFSGFTLFLYRYAGYQYLPLLNHLSKLCMLYFGLFFLVGAMLGAAMAARFKTNRLAAYSLTVAFVLLNTTFTDVPFRIPYLLFNSYKIERLLYSIKDFVTVVPYELGSSFRVYPILRIPNGADSVDTRGVLDWIPSNRCPDRVFHSAGCQEVAPHRRLGHSDVSPVVHAKGLHVTYGQ